MNKTPEERVKQSKDWRQRLDAILQEMKAHQLTEPGIARNEGRNLSLSITHLEDSIMRQGMVCKAINEENPGTAPDPYPESRNPQSPKVEPTADGIKL